LRIWIIGGPLDSWSHDDWKGDLPLILTYADAGSPSPGFQRGHIYELSVKTDTEAQYTYKGDTTHIPSR
jgi:hypothetical protein